MRPTCGPAATEGATRRRPGRRWSPHSHNDGSAARSPVSFFGHECDGWDDEYPPPDPTTGTAHDRLCHKSRLSAREPAVANLASLEWCSGIRDRECRARLVDIGRGGASVEADDTPPIGQDVWMRLETPAVTPWVRARVIRQDGPGRAEMEFDGPCPDDFLLAATLVITVDFGLAGPPPESTSSTQDAPGTGPTNSRVKAAINPIARHANYTGKDRLVRRYMDEIEVGSARDN